MINDTYLAHHGIKGQKWGVRRYQNTDGSLTNQGLKRYYGAGAKHKGSGEESSSSNNNSHVGQFLANHKRELAIGASVAGGALLAYGAYQVYDMGLSNPSLTREGAYAQKFADYSKRHVDKTISAGTTLHTLSFNPDRTKGVDSFFAAYKPEDADRYISRFNWPMRSPKGGIHCKLDVQNALAHDVKVASEDSAVDAFTKLFESDDDFRGFIMDQSRLAAHPDARKPGLLYRGYRDANKTLRELQKTGRQPTKEDMRKLHLLFNFAAPISSGDKMSKEMAADIDRQRTKFFDQLRENGYGAVLDFHDGLHGSYQSNAPVIFFDMDALIPQGAKQTKVRDIVSATFRDRKRQLAGTYQQA